MKMLAVTVAAVLCILLPGAAAVGANEDLVEALGDLERALESEQNLSPQFKSALTAVVGALREEDRTAPPQPRTVSAGSAGFLDRVTPFADLRLRHEWDGRRGVENRDRERARLRIGANVNLGENWSGGFRLRTGNPSDSQSPYHDMGRSRFTDMFGSWELNIDRAFLRYRPPFLDGSWITAGKFDHPFASNPIFGELVWDDDVNPEGVAVGYRLSPGTDVTLDFAAGQYLLVSNDMDSEVGVFVAQGAARIKVSETLNAMLAVGWYRYSKLNAGLRIGPLSLPPAAQDNAGNLIAPGVGYVSDFRVINPIASLSYTGLGVPITLSGEYIKNTGADSAAGGDDGFAVGVSVGTNKTPGDWQAYYQWQRIDQDAVFSAFAQDDFQQSTNFRGQVFGVRYKLTNRIGMRAWGLISRPERRVGPPDDYGTRLRFDVDAKF